MVDPFPAGRQRALASYAGCWDCHLILLGRSRVFAAFYFSTTIVSNSKTQGTIGATFTLVTWFIAMVLF
ncbi:MAG TPA: hypothetical protein VED63_04225 [Acidimicrobiales bacterium]|nr:hypothetical protein [Acidimicrobiales bacterium]